MNVLNLFTRSHDHIATRLREIERKLDLMAATLTDAEAAATAVASSASSIASAATDLDTAIKAFIASHPAGGGTGTPQDLQPVLDALSPATAALSTAQSALADATAALKAAP